MRKGQNPAKFVDTVARPKRITAAVLSYVPFLSGYYAQGLEVLRACLESMRRNPGLPFDTMVFDNGSCPEVREFLLEERDAGRVQYLVLSDRNVGKGGAWNLILGGAPGEIVSYCDSDVHFSADWLRRSVEILETYPNVGMVTARPFRTPPELYEATLAWARREAALESGQFIPWQTFLEFNLSLGQSEPENRRIYDETTDWRIVYKNIPAIAGGSHWQFTGWRATLQRFLPFAMDRPMGEVRQLDKRVNEAGLLRLMVPDPLAMNMSNTLPRPGSGAKTARSAERASTVQTLVRLRPVRRVLLALYHRIFRWYYE